MIHIFDGKSFSEDDDDIWANDVKALRMMLNAVADAVRL